MATRTLTEADRAAAVIFARALISSGRTHEEVAAEVGVSPGMVYQWAKPLRAISLLRAPAAAHAVGVDDPAKISVAYREWVAQKPTHALTQAPPAPGAAELARTLLAKATPRSHRALLAIIDAANAGKLDDADIELLGVIAKRFQSR